MPRPAGTTTRRATLALLPMLLLTALPLVLALSDAIPGWIGGAWLAAALAADVVVLRSGRRAQPARATIRRD